MNRRLIAGVCVVLGLLGLIVAGASLGSLAPPQHAPPAASLDAIARPTAVGEATARNAASAPQAARGASGALSAVPPVDRPSAPATAPGSQAPAQVLPSLDRLVIRTVTLSLLVADVPDAYRQVERIAAEQGGLIGASQVRQEGERTTATVTVRVPADPTTYAATMERLRALGDKVLDEQVQTQDVSEEYVDLESRLRNLRLTEERLLTLYDRAQRLEDVFAVQREITTVRGQIEQAQGRHQALERRAAMATINLQLRETAPAPRPRDQADWSPQRVAGEAVGALGGVLRVVGTVAIWLAIWLPLYGLPLLAAWLFRRRLGGLFRGADR